MSGFMVEYYYSDEEGNGCFDVHMVGGNDVFEAESIFFNSHAIQRRFNVSILSIEPI